MQNPACYSTWRSHEPGCFFVGPGKIAGARSVWGICFKKTQKQKLRRCCHSYMYSARVMNGSVAVGHVRRSNACSVVFVLFASASVAAFMLAAPSLYSGWASLFYFTSVKSSIFSAERDLVSFCRDRRLANIARSLAIMVQTVYIGRCVVLTTCWYEICGSRVERSTYFKFTSPGYPGVRMMIMARTSRL